MSYIPTCHNAKEVIKPKSAIPEAVVRSRQFCIPGAGSKSKISRPTPMDPEEVMQRVAIADPLKYSIQRKT